MTMPEISNYFICIQGPLSFELSLDVLIMLGSSLDGNTLKQCLASVEAKTGKDDIDTVSKSK